MLHLGSVNDISSFAYDEIWVIVRSIGSVKTGGNIYHIPQLSPSTALFHDYLAWRNQGLWNIDTFNNLYKPRFLEEMRNPVAQQYLKLLKEKSKVQDIQIVCFCKDEELCHRSIIRDLVEEENVMNSFYLLIAGSRSFDNYEFLRERCDYLLSNHRNDEIHIVSGGAKGADSLAERYARERGYLLHVFPAQWNLYGKSAGYKRNEQMQKFIAQYPHRGCVCFWDGESKGTQHNFDLCRNFNTPLRVLRF